MISRPYARSCRTASIRCGRGGGLAGELANVTRLRSADCSFPPPRAVGRETGSPLSSSPARRHERPPALHSPKGHQKRKRIPAVVARLLRAR
jgi:hypothetical protein